MQTDSIEKKVFCQTPIGGFSGMKNNKVVSGVLTCNSWKCPACKVKKLKKLKARIYKGAIMNDVISKYGMKFCTLTFGGKEKRKEYLLNYSGRDENGKPIPIYDFTKMYEDMSEAFHKLIMALKKSWGKFHYFRVHEPHKDGIPHFHILFVGNNIIPMGFRDHIEQLWRFRYKFGFIKLNSKENPKQRVRFNNRKHAINYILKYMTKDIVTAGKYKRVFSASVGSMQKTQKMEWDYMQVIFGRVTDSGEIIEEVIPEMEHGFMETWLDNNLMFVPKDEVVQTIVDRHLNNILINREY